MTTHREFARHWSPAQDAPDLDADQDEAQN
jgi:hypothetical protein